MHNPCKLYLADRGWVAVSGNEDDISSDACRRCAWGLHTLQRRLLAEWWGQPQPSQACQVALPHHPEI